MQPVQSVPQTQEVTNDTVFFELSLDLLCVASWDGYFKKVNPAFGKTLGYTNEELQDKLLLDFVHPEDRSATNMAIAQMQSKPTGYFENRYRCKNGSYQALAWTVHLVTETNQIYAVARSCQELQHQQTTQVNKTTAALPDSEAFYRTLAQNLPKAAVQIFDCNLRYYLLCEGKEMTTVGLSKAMLEGKTIWEVFPAEICAELEPIYRATLAGEEVEREIVYCDRIYAVHTVPVRNEHNEIFAGIVLIQNIDERKQTHAALRQSEETSRRQLAEIESIYSTAPIGLCFLDTDLRYVRVNEHLAEINGIPASEHIGKTVRELLPELGEVQAQIFEQVIKTGLPVLNIDVHGTTPAKPGVERDWLVSYYPLYGSNDQVLGINIMVQEITYRKQAAAALQEREKQLATILSNTPDVICRYNQEFRYIYISPAAEKVTRIPPEDFIGKTNHELGLAEDTIALWENALREVFATKLEKFIEFNYQHFSGTRCYYSSLMPEFTADKAVESVLVVSRDITERKQTEEALRESELNYRTLADTMPQLF